MQHCRIFRIPKSKLCLAVAIPRAKHGNAASPRACGIHGKTRSCSETFELWLGVWASWNHDVMFPSEKRADALAPDSRAQFPKHSSDNSTLQRNQGCQRMWSGFIIQLAKVGFRGRSEAKMQAKQKRTAENESMRNQRESRLCHQIIAANKSQKLHRFAIDLGPPSLEI